MKISNFLFLVLLILFSNNAIAQRCGAQTIFEKGTQIELTSFVKGVEVGKTKFSIESAQNSGNKSSALMKVVVEDENNVEQIEPKIFEYLCDGETIHFDLTGIMNEMVAVPDIEITAKGDLVEYPLAMAIGNSLKSASVTLNMKSKDFEMSIGSVYKDRKIVGQEKVTTAAGTFDCFKIDYQSVQNMRGTEVIARGEEWFSPVLGFIIRTKTYSPGGDLLSYTDLTKLTN